MSSLCPLPKNHRGHSPARHAPAHMAGGIAVNGIHQRWLSHAAPRAQRTAPARNTATQSRNCLGFAKGPLGSSRYAVRSSSSCGSAMRQKMRRTRAENKRAAYMAAFQNGKGETYPSERFI